MRIDLWNGVGDAFGWRFTSCILNFKQDVYTFALMINAATFFKLSLSCACVQRLCYRDLVILSRKNDSIEDPGETHVPPIQPNPMSYSSTEQQCIYTKKILAWLHLASPSIPSLPLHYLLVFSSSHYMGLVHFSCSSS